MPKSDLALDLSGYAPVADRLVLFYQKYPNGRIVTELVARTGGEIIFKASVFRDASAARFLGIAAPSQSRRDAKGGARASLSLHARETNAPARGARAGCAARA